MEISIDVLIADSRLAFVQGRYNESLKLADEALKVDENNSDAHQCAGNAYMSKQDYDNAIEHYKIAVENDADNGDRYFNLGYAYATSNQPVKALEMFAKADEIGCSPNVVGQLYKIMGMLCFDLHRYNDAIINLIKSEKVVGIDMDVLQRMTKEYSEEKSRLQNKMETINDRLNEKTREFSYIKLLKDIAEFNIVNKVILLQLIDRIEVDSNRKITVYYMFTNPQIDNTD